jgi:hypothetical protein
MGRSASPDDPEAIMSGPRTATAPRREPETESDTVARDGGNEPGVVLSWPGPEQVATLLHRDGPSHPNLLATRARLLSRGWRLVPLLTNPAAIDRLLAVQVGPVVKAAREIVASFGTAADSRPADVTAPVEPETEAGA